MAGGYNFRILGVQHLRNNLREAGPRATRALTASLFAEGQRVMGEAKKLAPVDTGTLRASGTVLPPHIEGDGRIVVTLGFGGAAKTYALIQHERLDYRHKVGQAKYLETAMDEAEELMPHRLAAGMKVWMRGQL